MENAGILENNLKLINKKNNDDTFRRSFLDATADNNFKLLLSKTGHPVPKVLGDNGKWFTLHSLVDPLKEAEHFAGTVRIKHNSIIVMLGVGRGYHVVKILSQTPKKQPLIIVEKNPHILKEFLSTTPLNECCKERDFYLFGNQGVQEIIAGISQIQIQNNFMPFSLIKHVPSVRSNYSFYSNIYARLKAANTVNIGPKFRYLKFKNKNLRILIIHSKYHLLGEILNSLKKMGHHTKSVIVQTQREGEGSHAVIEEIIADILTFKPDFILTVNHLGFDREGILTGFFTNIELPYASWYVDSPTFILEDFRSQLSPYLSIFVWDRDYVRDLQERGFEHVYFLPLASDPDIFRNVPARANPLRHLNCEVGFVGSSGENIISECMQKMQGDKSVKALLDKIALQFYRSRQRTLDELELDLNAEEYRQYRHLIEHMREFFEPAVTWRATQLYRMSCVKQLSAFEPHIHGDPGWQRHINSRSVLRPELNYYDELPYFYNVCKINFNTTSLQMKGGLNQRLFDIPACGAFILTDYREQVEEMFKVGQEVACYSEPAEIKDMVSYYLRHPSQRMKIVAKAHDRVLKEHTYEIRLKKLIEHMKGLYA